MTDLSVRPATDDDLPFLLDLRRATMTPHLIASGIEPSDEVHRERVLARFDCAGIVLVDGRPAGLLKVTRDGREWEIVQIQIAPPWQRRGLGTRLLRGVIEEARASGASLRLGVLKANPARAWYERLGFSVAGETEHGLKMLLDHS